jgi:hypothetical protein
VYPPAKPTRWLLPVAVAAGVTAIVVIVGLVLGFWVRDLVVTAIGPDVPTFTTVEEAVTYYEDERAAARAFVTDTPFGYDFERVELLITDLDLEVATEAARADPDLRAIAGWGYDIHSLIADFTEDVAQWELTYAPRPELLTNASGTVAEGALDTISGGVADVVFDDYCGDPEEALACVAGGTLVHVPTEHEHLTDAELTAQYGDFWMSVMAHEYGHVVQNKYENRLLADPDYQRLFIDIEQPPDADEFNVDIEYSADCMGAVLLPEYVLAYIDQCSPEQLAFAATIWDGSFYQG